MERPKAKVRMPFAIREQNGRVEDSKAKYFVLHKKDDVFSPGSDILCN